MSRVVEVEEIVKRYGSTVAVDGISFAVEAGEIFGMVGPNGAGKTTTIECLEGLRRPDSGSIRVLGLDPGRSTTQLHERIGIQLQESSISTRMKVWEALDLFSAFYERSLDWRELLPRLGLEEKRDALFSRLSGGQKQRLFIALALVNDPELVFLDELTTGLDPHARRSMWDLVRGVREQGKSVLLTTHFMEEAERLCDRVAIIDRGRIVALDTPHNLIHGLEGDSRIVLTTSPGADVAALAALAGVAKAEQSGERLEVHGKGEGVTSRVIQHLVAAGIDIRDVKTEQATLEDVFLTLTGRRMEEGESA